MRDGLGKIKIRGVLKSINEKSSLNDYVSGRAILERHSSGTNFSIKSSSDFESNFKKAVEHANIKNSSY